MALFDPPLRDISAPGMFGLISGQANKNGRQPADVLVFGDATITSMPAEVHLRIVLEKPPAGVDYGLQKGSGSNYQTEQLQRGDGGDLRFDFSLSETLRGPYVQGPTGGKFVYIDIGTCAGQAGTCWSRRLKVPLAGITPEMITSGAILEARMNGTARDGGPACATPKPFGGWRAVKR